MSLLSPFSRRLYLRIWLAVVGGVLVFALAAGFAWQWAADQNRRLQQPPMRDITITDGRGRTLVQGEGQRLRPRGEPGEGVIYRIEADDGRVFEMHLGPRPRRLQDHLLLDWLRPPYSFIFMLALVGVAVTLGVFPIIRRLLQRLELLQKSMQRFGEGDLSVRVPEQGQDEVADLTLQFNAAAARIQALVQSHKSLLANASHELRSPLARLRMGLELLQGGQGAPASRAEMERNINELDQLVEEILLASRLDSGVGDIGALEPVELLGLAAEECARVGAELELPDDASAAALELPGNAKLLRRALRNLLENARRYSQGAITLHLGQSRSWAELQVCDHGPGVPPAQRERIFEPFYRLPGASERAGGVGLGLALVRSIAQRHGGTVLCQDRPDGAPGACFVLRLPLTQHSATPGTARSTPPGSPE